MASLGNNDALLLLANVALANYAQEQQLAHGGATQGAVDNTLPAQSANSASESGLFDDLQDGQLAQTSGELGLLDDYSTEDEQPSTQNANSTDSSPAQAASSQGFTPIDPAAITGGFTPRMTRSRTRHAATPIGPSGGRHVTKKWQKTKPRTTGFNRQTGKGIFTDVCGVVTAAKGKPKASKKETSEKSRYGCPRCNDLFTRARTVKDHFIKCVRKYGNPKGLCWYDHPTLSGSKGWALDQMGMTKDENEVEENVDEYEDAEQDDDVQSEHGEDENEVEENVDEYEDAEQDDGAESEHDDDYNGGQDCEEQGYDNEHEHGYDNEHAQEQYEQDGNVAQTTQHDNTAVEEYQGGGPNVGEEDQGPYNNMYA